LEKKQMKVLIVTLLIENEMRIPTPMPMWVEWNDPWKTYLSFEWLLTVFFILF